MQVQDSFSAKVMLFGEYSILLGSPALSVPFDYFSARLGIPSDDEDRDILKHRESNKMLRKFYNSTLSKQGLFSDVLDLSHLREELDSGLYLESTIPSKYGVGSSGALCAALYYRYAYKPLDPGEIVEPEDLVNLRKIFISMESFFHGKSSGLDPLVIYLRHPLIINEDGLPFLANIPGDFMPDNGKIFLIDTGQSTGTGTLVPLFLKQYSPQGEKEDEGRKLCELNQSCITHFWDKDIEGFRKKLQLLSEFQFQHLSAMIPDHMRVFWSEGLESGLFSLKLCGSGGGGFLTGFTPDFERTLDYFRKQEIPVIPVDIDHGLRVNTTKSPDVDQKAVG